MRLLFLSFLFISLLFSPGFSQRASILPLSTPPAYISDSLSSVFQPDSLFPANPFIQINNQFTGTFISEDGLILTTKKALREEKVNRDSNEEVSLQGVYARRQLYKKKVTEEVLEEVEPGFSSEKKVLYVQRNIRRLIREAQKKHKNIQFEVKALLGEREYEMYAWESFSDVRLVSASKEQDFIILRIYQGDQPYRAEHFLSWAKEPSEEAWTAVYGYPKETFLNTLPLQKTAFFNQLLPFQIQVRNSMLEVWENNRSDQAGLERKLERLQLEKVAWEELAYQDLILYIQARIQLAHNQTLGTLEATHAYRQTLEEQKQLLQEWTESLQAVILLQEVLQKNLQLFNLFRQLEFLELPAMNPAPKQQKEVQSYLDNFYASFDRTLEAALFEEAMQLYFTQLPTSLQSPKVGQKYAEAKKDFQEMGRIAFASSLFFKPKLVQAKLDQGRDPFLEMLQRDYLYEIYKEIKQLYATLNRKQLPEIESRIAGIQAHYYEALSLQQQLLPEANGSLRYSIGRLEPINKTIDHHAVEGMEGAPIVNTEGKIVGIFTGGEKALLDLEEWIYEQDLVKWSYKKQ